MDEQKKVLLLRRPRGYIYISRFGLTSCLAAAILLVSLGDGIAEEVDTLNAGRTVRGARSPPGKMQWIV